MTPRPRRSMLYTPATRPDRVEKALLMEDGPDMVVCDLEDAVAPGDKDDARKQAVEVIDRVADVDTERCIRVNPAGTPWHEDDLAAIAQAQPDALVVPKVDDVGELTDVELALEDAEAEHGLEEGAIPMLVQLENAGGIANAARLAQTVADPVAPLTRVEAFVFGAEDYAADVGARRTASNTEVLYARSRTVLAAALAGVQAIDQVHVDYQDLDALAAEARGGRDLGFVGKQIIHPDQIGPVHEAFTPSQEEIDEARDLLAAVEEADIGEGGVISHEGRMVDRPVIEQARRVVAMAETLGL